MNKNKDFKSAVESLSQHFCNNQIKLTEIPIHDYYNKNLGDSFYADGSMWHNPVDDMFYRINNIGLSGEDFDSDAEGLALGCSVTAGCGLWHRWTWPYIVSLELGYPINSLGLPGRSFSDCVEKFFDYIKLFGKPKNVFIFTPDMFRFKSFEASGGENFLSFYTYSWFSKLNNYVSSYDKPHVYRDIFGEKRSYPVELGIGSYIQSLSLLLSACSALGVDLKIGSWDYLTSSLLRKAVPDTNLCNDSYLNSLKSVQDSMGSIQPYLESINSLGCHSDHAISKNKYWCISADKIHPGIHAQIHYAEMFLNKPVSAETLDCINLPLPGNVNVAGGLE